MGYEIDTLKAHLSALGTASFDLSEMHKGSSIQNPHVFNRPSLPISDVLERCAACLAKHRPYIHAIQKDPHHLVLQTQITNVIATEGKKLI
jgi:hypothetical protein